MIRADSKRGFTLIEMMVVVAIIALLASVVLVFGDQARITARNTQRLQLVSDYRVALDLAYDANGKFPKTVGLYPLSDACLGTYPSGTCWSGFVYEEAAVDAVLNPYIPSAAEYPAVGLGGADGLLYASTGLDDYDLTWMLEGINKNCAPGRVQNGNYFGTGNTFCEFERNPAH